MNKITRVSELKWVRLLIAAALMVPLAVGEAVAGNRTYSLGPQDKLRLRIFEWRAPIDQIYEWTAMNDEFTVGPSGTVSLPLLGEVPAEGRTTSELAQTIAELMAKTVKLRSPPTVALEISQYRPFYIAGVVAKPGAYPYQPDMTILQALSIAGGMPRPAKDSYTRLGREIIAGRGSVKQLASKTKELLARKARLEAEQTGVEKLVFPKELTGFKEDTEIARILQQEDYIFNARTTALKTQISTLNRLKDYLNKEVSSLEKQAKLKQKELSTVNKELGNIISLVKKGLTPSNRQFSLERLASQIASEKLRLDTALLRAKQDISRTDVAIDEAQNKNAIDIASQLRTTEAELEQTKVQYDTEGQLLYDSEVIFPKLVSSRKQNTTEDEPKYTIVRTVEGKPQRIDADELTEVLPGDTINVELPVQDNLPFLYEPSPRATQ